tara:strand:- start:1214 stop:1597 length:384 start_codon:yes stop_codon:yes gene_type:complete
MTKTTIVNPSSYAGSRDIVRTMEVNFILDQVPGAYNKPIDLMKWINGNSYVHSVTYDDEPAPELVIEPQPQLMFHKLKVLLGSPKNGSNKTVHMYQNGDVWILNIGNETFTGPTLTDAINAAYAADL